MEKVVYRELRLWRAALRKMAAIKNRKLIEKNRNKKILIILHLFYDESWKEIRQYLKNLDQYQVDIAVTSTKGRLRKHTVNEIKGENRTILFEELPNQGFDVGPFFYVIDNIDCSQYDCVFKLHSKGTKRPFQYIYKQVFFRRGWFLDLFGAILSAFNAHRVIDEIVTADRPTMIAPRNLIINDPGYKMRKHISRAHELGIPLNGNYKYVAGTCFACSSCHIEVIRRMGISISDFEPSEATAMWDLAHLLERCICCSPEQDFRLIGFDTPLARIRRLVKIPVCMQMKILYPSLKKIKEKLGK